MQKHEWEKNVLENLSRAGAEGISVVEFIRNRGVKIGFAKQLSNTGANWFIDGNLYLNKDTFSYDTPPAHVFMLSTVAHEVCHLRQGFFTALSVYGELEAWQYGFRIFQTLGGVIGHAALKELMSLPLGYDRAVLARARVLMLAYAGKGYRVDLLPLYPLGKEIAYLLFKKIPA